MKAWPGLVAVAMIAGVLGVVVANSLRAPPALEDAVWLDTPRALPPIAVVDETGTERRLDAATGQWQLVFPGFTYCPDICPDTLARLAQVPGQIDGLTIRLFTVDPERDTPDRLAEYVRHFHAEFGALATTGDDLAAAARALSIAYVHVPLEGGSYTMDHSTAMALIGPDGRLVGFVPRLESIDTLVSDVRHIMDGVNRGRSPRG